MLPHELLEALDSRQVIQHRFVTKNVDFAMTETTYPNDADQPLSAFVAVVMVGFNLCRWHPSTTPRATRRTKEKECVVLADLKFVGCPLLAASDGILNSISGGGYLFGIVIPLSRLDSVPLQLVR